MCEKKSKNMKKACIQYEENINGMRWDKTKRQEERWCEKSMREVKIEENRERERCEMIW